MRWLILLFLSLSCLAQPPLRLVFNVVEPWKYYDEHGKPSGAYVDIARELARRLGTTLQVVDCPLKRCLMLLQHGEADFVIGLQSTPEREVYLQFLNVPYRKHAPDYVFYLRTGDADRLHAPGDLVGLRIGAKMATQIAERLGNKPGLTVDAVPDSRNNFAKLLLKRIDVVAIPEDQGEFLITTMHLQGRVAKAPYRMKDGTPRSVAVARQSPLADRVEALNTAMAAMREDGTLARLYRDEYYVRFGISQQSIDID